MNATSIYSEIQTALKRGERVAVATVVKTIGAAPCGVGTKMLVRADGATSGSFAGSKIDTQVAKSALQALQEGKSSITHVHLDPDQAVGSCGATLELFIEVLYPEPRLIIAGAGNVAQALARLASQLDYRIVVVDDRRDLADPHMFGDKIQLTFGDIPQTIRELEPDEASWIVIVTRGHHLDKDALRAALETSARYVGMIGSPGKIKNIFRDLLREGMPRERLEQVHSPIGLDLGAETPEEIALSIAAEMLMLRKHGTGVPLKSLHHFLDDLVAAESH
ncbi:MAG TPA: XdhC/CoxI family protein [Ktedonobacteraceae bacterium]|jgi:xanthine dehydrogenase accessory factor|nr:XdhC/CoxI family protein [Ktedonobacteraceae bacterium]